MHCRTRVAVSAVVVLAAASCGSSSTSSSSQHPPTSQRTTTSVEPTVPRGAYTPHTAPYPPPTPIVPRLDVTPGATDPRVTAVTIHNTICARHYRSTVSLSKPEAKLVKVAVMTTYRSAGMPADYQLDHLIPLELGGSNDQRNLWPEPWERMGARLVGAGHGAESKDKVELALQLKVCAGQITLADAQRLIAADWVTALR